MVSRVKFGLKHGILLAALFSLAVIVPGLTWGVNDVSVELNASGIGNFSGNIINSTQVYYFNVSHAQLTAGLRINLTNMTGSGNLSLNLYDSSSNLKGSFTYTAADNTSTWSFSSSWPISGTWSVSLVNTNTTAGSNVTFNGTVEALNPDMIINGTLSSGSPQFSISENIQRNRTIVLHVDINNSAGYALDINGTTSSGRMNMSTDYSKFLGFTHNITTGTIGANSKKTYNITIDLNSTSSGNTAGNYDGYITVEASNGYPSTTYTLHFRIALSSSVKMNMLGFTSSTSSDPWINESYENATAYVNVSYLDGTPIDASFSGAYLKYPAEVGISDVSIGITNATRRLAEGIYKVDLNVSNINTTFYAGGNYNVTLTATNGSLTLANTSNEVFKREGSGLYVVDFTTNASSPATSAGIVLRARVKNIGYKDADPYVRITGADSCMDLVTGGCDSFSACHNATTISPGNTTYLVWFARTKSSGASCTLSLANYSDAGGSGTWFPGKSTGSLSITVANTSSDSTTTTTTTPGSTPNDLGTLSITDYTKEVKIIQGRTGTATVKVKNVGTTNLANVNVSVIDVDRSWWSGGEAQDIIKLAEKTYTINYNIPLDATVKNYTIKYESKSSNGVVQRVIASLVVLPGSASKAGIAENVTDYQKQYSDLLILINATKARGGDTSAAEALLSDVSEMIAQADQYTTEGDWLAASQLGEQISTKLQAAKAELNSVTTELDKQSIKQIVMLGGAAVAVIIAGIIVYLMLPPKHGYKSKTGVAFGSKGSKQSKLTILMNRMKEKLASLKKKDPTVYGS